MNDNTQSVPGLILTTFLRYIVVAAVGWLIKKSIIDKGTADALQSPETIAYLVAGVATLGTGIYLRLRSRFKTNTALAMPAGATNADLNQVVAATPVSQIISTQPPTKAEIRTAAQTK